MPRMCYTLPLAGHALRNVEGEGRFDLGFDDSA
ncbi:uncharacterized protein SOCE26_069480 [Sorangium cellulosum]|uniref:Uncharacterized protein n=1 Tax=Sorangium cellulosum TaxID=56 RepID=A0A2L0F1Q6_SORCE|nr:uncharacterized protein SOCE26_069480 [Sorangium cellulosum]